MSAQLAAVVLAHDDPPKVRRLLAALDGVDVFLHCDRRTPDGSLAEMLAGAGPRVSQVPRHRASVRSWSLVEAELAGLRLALERSKGEHVIVLSGACYPLVSVAELEDELSRWRGVTRMRLDPLPYESWNTPRNPDGGLWRFKRRFVTFRGRIVSLGDIPLRAYRRAIPDGVGLHASAQWKIYARDHATTLLRVLGERPDLVTFWRTSFVPDESCPASILRSPALVGRVAEEIFDDLPWFIRWAECAWHPDWLGQADFEALEAARNAPPRSPDLAVERSPDRDRFRKLFARKVSSRESKLLDWVDAELRQQEATSDTPAPSRRAFSPGIE
jgi:Core-2/I-Branching enzyme